MKKARTKHTIIFLLLFILGLYIFYLGFTPLKIKPDSCGVIQTKTNGVLQQAVIPGKYSWNWQFLLPTNAKLTNFTLKPYNASKYISGSIPVSNALSGLSESTVYSDALNYSFTFNIGISYTPEAVIKLVEKNYISNDQDFAAYLDGVASTIAQDAAAFYLTKSKNNSSFEPLQVKRNEVLNAINVYRQFPELDITIFALTDFKLPVNQ